MKMKMMCAAIALVMTSGCVPAMAHAQQGATVHPSYFRALDDLRAARHYLSDNWTYAPVTADSEAAVREIDGAIQEIKTAAIEDGKNLNDTARIDTRLSPHERYRKAQEYLAAAHQQMAMENVPSERDLEHRINVHLDRARDIVGKTETTAKWQ